MMFGWAFKKMDCGLGGADGRREWAVDRTIISYYEQNLIEQHKNSS